MRGVASRILITIIMVLLVAVPACATTISSNVTTNTVWNLAGSPYVITASIQIGGTSAPILTIDPGVVVQFNSGTYFQVGNGNPGGIIANGASFTGTTKSPGQWVIYLYSQTISTAARFVNCQMEYGSSYTFYVSSGSLDIQTCTIQNGSGDGIQVNGTVTLLNISNCTIQSMGGYGINAGSNNPSVHNCEFKDIGGYGVYASQPSITNCEFDNTGNFPISTDAASIATFTGLTFTNITSKPGIDVRGGIVANSGTWINYNMPYNISANFNVQGASAPILTLQPGVVLKFNSGTYMQIGNSNPGGIMAVGTPSNRIQFTGNTVSPGQWTIYLNSQTISTAARFDYCDFQYGGGSYSLYVSNGSLDLRHSVMKNGAGDAIYASTPTLFSLSSCTIQSFSGSGINGSGTNPSIKDCLFKDITNYGLYVNQPSVINTTIDNTGNYPISLDAARVANLNTLTFTNITSKVGIEVRGGTVDQTGTWNNFNMPYIISANISIQGGSVPILTLQPGQIIKFNSGTYFQIGSNNPGGIMAVGTPGNPIQFIGSTPTPGQWTIYLNSQTVSTAALFDYCLFQYGGGSYTFYLSSGALDLRHSVIKNGQGDAFYASTPTLFSLSSCTIQSYSGYGINGSGTNPSISDCVFKDIGSYGLYVNQPSITNTVIDNTGNYPISLDANVVANLSGISFANITAKPGIEVRGGTVSQTGTWGNFNMPYVISATINIQGVNVPILTISPGDIIKFNTGTYLQIGNSSPGGIIAVGTPGNPIQFLGSTPTPGQWTIYLNTQTISTAALFDYCVFKNGGASYSIYISSGALDLRHSVLQNGSGDAIYASGSPTLFSVSSCTIQNYTGKGINASNISPIVTNCYFSALGDSGVYADAAQISNCVFSSVTGYPVSLTANGIKNLSNITYLNLAKPGIEVRGGTASDSGTWPNVGIPYVITQSMNIFKSSGTCNINIQEGTIIKLGSGIYMQAGNNSGSVGTLSAVGTNNQPIYFTSIKDDSLGGDSNGDGISFPSPGDWAYVFINQSDNSLLDHCIIRYGGSGGTGNVYINSSQATIQYCNISQSASNGIYSYYSNPVIAHNAILNNALSGVRISGSPIPTNIEFNNIVDNANGFQSDASLVSNFKNNNISSNTTLGGSNAYNFINIFAQKNWWGDASGPYDGSTIGLYNPNGLGNGVTDHIDYSNWLTQNPLQPSGIPDIKLFIGQSVSGIVDLDDYLIDTAATWSWSPSIDVNEVRLNINNTTNVVDYLLPQDPNYFGQDTITFTANNYAISSSVVKYSTYKLLKFPKVGISTGNTWDINVANYAYNSTGPAIPPSLGTPNSAISSDSSKVTATWLNSTILRLTCIASFTGSINVDVVASPNTVYPFDIDQDKERIVVDNNLIANSSFNAVGDTTLLIMQTIPGYVSLPTFNWLNSKADGEGNTANGVLEYKLNDATNGGKITLQQPYWNTYQAGQWYIARARIFATETAYHQFQLFHYNGQPGAGHVDIATNITYGVPLAWTWFETPLYARASSSAGIMQFFVKAASAGNIYVDEIQVIKAAPSLIDFTRGNIRNYYQPGLFGFNSDATSGFALQQLGSAQGSPTVSVSSGSLRIDFTGATGSHLLGMKMTAAVGGTNGTLYTPSANIGKEIGARALYTIQTGTFTSGNSLILVAAYGVNTSGSTDFTKGGQVIASAEFQGLTGSATAPYQAIAKATRPYYQVQFQAKNDAPGIMLVDDVDYEVDNDDPYYGDRTLFVQ